MKEIIEKYPRPIEKDFSKRMGNNCPICYSGKVYWKNGKACCTKGCDLSDFVMGD